MPRPSTRDYPEAGGVQGRSGAITKEDLARRQARSNELRSKWAKEDEISKPSIRPNTVENTKPAASMYAGLKSASLKSASKRKRPEGSEEPEKRVKSEENRTPLAGIPDAAEDVKPSGSGWAPERKGPRKPSTQVLEKYEVNSRVTGKSEWYNNINMKASYGRSDLISLQQLNHLAKRYTEAWRAKKADEKRKLANELRDKIHNMELATFVNGVLIKKSRVLEDNGLPAIFASEEDVDFPFDVKADARALYNRWMAGDIDPHLLRHIITEKSTLVSGLRRTAHRLDPTFERKSPYVVGDNDIVNGQWWPNRVCLMRDGAHGELEAGISGQTGRGAYSIVVASGGYKDEDLGEVIMYCGTESKDEDATFSTNLMLETERMGQVLRVMRAENKKSKFAPKKGIRYDGLYRIVGHALVDQTKAMYVFTLTREPGQDPIRFAPPEVRPTDLEIKAFANIQTNLATMK